MDWRLSCLTFSVLLVLLKGCECADNASELIRTLLTDYEMSVLPSCLGSSIPELKIGIAVRQIIELNEPKQILQTNIWMRMRWDDCRLKWNESENGVPALKIPHGRIWIPDIALYDSAENELGGLEDYLQDIRPAGTVSYNFPTVIKSLCKIDVTYFPFDKQTCRLTFGSWTLTGWELNVTTLAPDGDLSSYIANVEWHVVAVPAVRNVAYYGCCPEPFPDVTFHLKLERKPQFYVLSLMFPSILISSIALLGFILPPESGEKVSLEITVLLSIAVFMLMVSDIMPPNSETFPYIGLYFACAMLLVSLSCLMTVTVLNLHFKGKHGTKMPAWVRIAFLNYLGRLLRVTKASNKISDVSTDKLDMVGSDDDNNTTSRVKVVEHKLEITDYTPPNKFVDLLDRQLEALQTINNAVSKPGKDNSSEEWKRLARVIDRLCLILFFTLQLVGISILIIGTGFSDA